ncbi:hypothetical protein A1O3_04544 [Capronia epimyces CBS 606.96]|uniref:Uncharacterized protein n=1 Tax=Capronia epimyces CBS 606.96 TaxID=1182542 RepID=W9YZ64_9EURO|nr:uncharacterized protein A1O3_04544 [Capronia epimyces CBS 606.96]EXJ87584.1 hypothetical protein A1O3_04544 [Capronia epimyces CBS 606.96]
MVNLTDSSGEIIVSNLDDWYRIVLADGSELGFGDAYPSKQNVDRTLIKIVPAGQGLVFRYQRTDGGDRLSQGWPIGDKGWLRGKHVKPDGTEVVKNLSLSWEPTKLALYESNDNYGFVAQQLPGNRVALYAYDRHGSVLGLAVTPDKTVIGYASKYATSLDVSFVKTGSHFKGHF